MNFPASLLTAKANSVDGLLPLAGLKLNGGWEVIHSLQILTFDASWDNCQTLQRFINEMAQKRDSKCVYPHT